MGYSWDGKYKDVEYLNKKKLINRSRWMKYRVDGQAPIPRRQTVIKIIHQLLRKGSQRLGPRPFFKGV